MIAAQRQGHADFTNRAVVDDGQEIISRRRARRGKDSSIGSAVTGADHCHHIALGIPEGAVAVVIQLAILRVDVLGCRDGVLGTGQRAGFIHEVAAFCFACHPRVNAARLRLPARQHLAGLADGQLTESFMVGILFANYQRVHAVFVFITGRLINAVGGDGKVYIETSVCIVSKNPVFIPGSVQPFVIESVGAADLHNTVFAQGKFFRQGQDALVIGVECADIFGKMAVYGVGHGNKFGIALIVIAIVPHVIQPVDLERRARQQYGFAGFLVNFGDAQIDLNFLVQNRELLIAVRAGQGAVFGRCHGTPRVVILRRINAHKERLCLIQVLRGGGFHHKVSAIGQPLYADVAGVAAEDLGQLVFVGVAGGLPSVTLAVLVFSGSGQGLVVGGDLSGVDFVSFGNGLRFARKIPFQMRIVIAFVDIGIQNALQRVSTGAGLVKLTHFGKVRHQIKSKSGVFQFHTIGLPAGGNDLTDFHIALGNLILTFGKGVVGMQMIVCAIAGLVDLFTGSLPVIAEGGLLHIPALIGISRCNVVVVLIAQIAVGERKRISIIGPAAVQCLALGDGAELVFIHPIGVFTSSVSTQRRDLSGGGLGTAVHGGIGAGNSKSALPQRNDRAGGALYYIIFAEVQVCEGQPAVLDFCAGYQMVFFEHWQVIRYPLAAIVADGRAPDGIAIGIHDFGIIHNAGYAVRVGDVLGSIEVVHGTV